MSRCVSVLAALHEEGCQCIRSDPFDVISQAQENLGAEGQYQDTLAYILGVS